MAKKKKQKKVRCAECKAQYNKFCTIKKVTVSLNKDRLCNNFTHDQAKVKIKQVLPTTRIGFTEQEKLRKQRKKDLKKLKEHLKREGLLNDNNNLNRVPKNELSVVYNKPKEKETLPESRIYKPYGDEKYPLTGDLSRFTTTGTKKEEEKEDE